MPRKALLFSLLPLLLGCGPRLVEPRVVDGGTTAPQPGITCGTLAAQPAIHRADTERAARGKAWLTERMLGQGLIPKFALRQLWVVWGTAPVVDDAAYWSQFGERYGFHPAPFDNQGLPMGIRTGDNGLLTFDCLSCHAGTVAGQPIIGAPNTTIDFESLYDDLVALNALAPTFGYPSFAVPFDLNGFTYSRGAHDAFGLAFRLSGAQAAGLDTTFGPQRAPGLWTLALKERTYADGSGPASGHRTMMAMFLAFGLTAADLQTKEASLEDVAPLPALAHCTLLESERFG